MANHVLPDQYIVFDGRYASDPDRAAVLEAYGPNRPAWKALQRDWGDQGAVLVRWYAPDEHGIYTKTEVLGVIK